MSSPAKTIDVWTHGACAGGGYGGWSYVIRQGDQWRGVAGGATRTDAEAMALTALLAALDSIADAPKASQVALHLEGAALPDGSERDPELAGRLARIQAARPGWLGVAAPPSPASAGAWRAFLSSWADFARDKAKTRGAFSAAIPRLNIAKFVQDAI